LVMAQTSDVRDILDLETTVEVVTKDSLFNQDRDRKKKSKKNDSSFKKPEGMHRELWGLLCNDSRDAPPLIQTDTNMAGYKQMKAKIGRSKVRPWKWMPFSNPARTDGATFHHWRREADEGKDYPFARFNKSVDVAAYSEMEYQQMLHDEAWTRAETDYLFQMCNEYDLRFIVIHDRWDLDKYAHRSVEDMKERYYNICNILAGNRAPAGTVAKQRQFDSDHERRRKDQLCKLFKRTQDDCEEEENLVNELKKIEMRKKERDKKTLDLQKLITAADSSHDNRHRADRKQTKKKLATQQKNKDGSIKTTPDTTGIKFADFKTAGCSVRSQRMKLPSSLGQKKMKAIEQVLDELGIEMNPIPSEDIVTHFNELRQDIVLLYELKLALANCEYELQTLRHRYETLAPGKLPDLGSALANALLSATPLPTHPPLPPGTPEIKQEISLSLISGSSSERRLSETIDVVGPGPLALMGPGTPNRKRRAALEQSNLLKKIKQKM